MKINESNAEGESANEDESGYLCNHIIAVQTRLDVDEDRKRCTWSAFDFSDDPPTYRWEFWREISQKNLLFLTGFFKLYNNFVRKRALVKYQFQSVKWPRWCSCLTLDKTVKFWKLPILKLFFKIQIFKTLNFENSNFLNHCIMKYLKNLLNFDFKKRYTLTTSLWDWYLTVKMATKFEILPLYSWNFGQFGVFV